MQYTPNHQTVHFNEVNYIVCELHLNKTAKKNNKWNLRNYLVLEAHFIIEDTEAQRGEGTLQRLYTFFMLKNSSF